MSPLRDCEGFNIDDPERVRVAFSQGYVLYAARSLLVELSAAQQPQELGRLMPSLLNTTYHALILTPSPSAAAELFRDALIAQLEQQAQSAGTADALRDDLHAALLAARTSPVSDPFGIIFRAVSRQAELLFGQDWPQNVQFRTEAIRDPPFHDTRFWLTAVTSGDPPCVKLRVNPYELNPETYAAIFPVLAHECFCHVASNPADQSNESIFSEGFCDWAAQKLLDRWLDDAGDPALSIAARILGVHVWKVALDPGGGNRFWKQRLWGHYAAECLVNWYRQESPMGHVAEELVICLAKDLVVLDERLSLKEAFVKLLYGKKFPEGLQESLRQYAVAVGDANARMAYARKVLHFPLP